MEQHHQVAALGLTLESQNFLVKFVGGFQKGSSIPMLEEVLKEVMEMTLDELETFPTSLQKTEECLAGDLKSWIIARTGLVHFNIKTKVQIEEQSYFTPPFGSKKSLRICLSDTFNTELLFQIKKKSVMKSLKDLGAESVADSLKHKEDIAELEIPITLILNLLKEFNNDWNPKYHKSNLTVECESAMPMCVSID